MNLYIIIKKKRKDISIHIIHHTFQLYTKKKEKKKRKHSLEIEQLYTKIYNYTYYIRLLSNPNIKSLMRNLIIENSKTKHENSRALKKSERVHSLI